MDRRTSRAREWKQRMSRGSFLLPALAVCLFALWVTTLRPRPPQRPEPRRSQAFETTAPLAPRTGEATGAEVATRVTLSGAEEKLAPDEPAKTTSPAPTDATTSALKIRVLDPNRDAVGRAWIEIGHTVQDADTEHVLRRRTNDEGELELQLAPGSVRLLAWTREAIGGPLFLDLEPRDPAGGEVELHLSAGHPIAGRVVDQDTGAPIEGATISIWTFSETDCVRTEADGTFRHPRFPAGRTAQQLRVEAPGYGPAVRYLRVSADGSWELPAAVAEARSLSGDGTPWLELQLSAELRIRGTVVDPRGRPVESAVVSAEGFFRVLPRVASRDGAEDQTTHGGAFLLRGLRPDIGHAVSVRAAGFAERIVEVPADAGGEHDLGLLQLERETVLVGVVTDPDGHPVEDIEVVLVPLGLEASSHETSGTGTGTGTGTTTLDVEVRVDGTEERVRTGVDGTFLFEHLQERPYELRVRRDSQPLVTLDLEPVPGQGFPDVELGLPYHTLTMVGTVTGPEGPLANARVELRRYGVVATVTTNAAGRFRIAGLDDVEAYSLRVHAVCTRTGAALTASEEAWGFESPSVTVAGR